MSSDGPQDPQVEELVAFARGLARAARGVTLDGFGSNLRADDKGDPRGFDPVTEADRQAELSMRELIDAAYPDHGLSGEEFEDRAGASPYSWSLDPIDGTRSFICGLPTWTTLIGLLRDGAPIIGVIDAPRLGETYVGVIAGDRNRCEGPIGQLRASACRSIGEARLSTTDPYLFEGRARERFDALRAGARTTRYGHDAYAYARLAAGSIDLVVESGLKTHDYQALIPVVRGAGGTFGDWQGGSDFSNGDVIAAATPALYEAAVEFMQGD